MNQTKRLHYFYILIIIFVLAAINIVMIATRDIEIPGDTKVYTNYFLYVLDVGYDYSRTEPLFKALTLALSKITIDPKIYFGVIGIIILTNISICTLKLSNLSKFKKIESLFLLIAVFGCMFASSWYFAATTNGLRQGIAISFLFLSLAYYLKKSYFHYLLFSITAIYFHTSSILFVLAPIATSFIPSKYIPFLFLITLINYYFGINEFIIKSVIGLPEEILKSFDKYDSTDSSWFGFVPIFVAYNVVWYIILNILTLFITCKRKRASWTKLLDIYAIYSMVFFVFGFAGFPNRVAFVSWLYIQMITPFALYLININKKDKYFITIIFTIISELIFLKKTFIL